MIWKPHVTVAALAERDGRFLLVEENVGGETVYNQPAGHLEKGESLIEAVMRETLEETAWHFRPEALLGVYRWPHPHKDLTYLRFAFIGTVERHEPDRPLDDGIIQSLWWTPDEIRQTRDRHRSPQVLRCVEDYLAGQRAPLGLLHDVLT